MSVLLAVACVTNVSAASLDSSLGFPKVVFKNYAADFGTHTATTYNAITHEFIVTANPHSIQFSATSPPVLLNEPDLLTIKILVANDGTLIGGTSSDDLLITDNNGYVLTGEIIAFGYQNSPGNNDSFYLEGSLWFISSDIQAGIVPTYSLGTRIGIF